MFNCRRRLQFALGPKLGRLVHFLVASTLPLSYVNVLLMFVKTCFYVVDCLCRFYSVTTHVSVYKFLTDPDCTA